MLFQRYSLVTRMPGGSSRQRLMHLYAPVGATTPSVAASSPDPPAAAAAPRVMLLCGADLVETFTAPGVWQEAHLRHILGDDHGVVCIARWDDRLLYHRSSIASCSDRFLHAAVSSFSTGDPDWISWSMSVYAPAKAGSRDTSSVEHLAHLLALYLHVAAVLHR